MRPEEVDACIALNLTSIYYTCRAVVPLMREQGGGVDYQHLFGCSTLGGAAAQGLHDVWRREGRSNSPYPRYGA